MELAPQQDLLAENELNIQYAGFWQRFFALLIDGIVLSILTPLSYYNTFRWQSIPLLILLFMIQIVFKPFFEYKYGATPGKMTLSIKVVNYDYAKANFFEVLLRNVFQILFLVAFMLIGIYKFNHPVFTQSLFNEDNYLSEYSIPTWSIESIMLVAEFIILAIYVMDAVFMITNDERRSLHDRMGRTYVIRSK